MKIKYSNPNNNNNRIFELPYGYVGIKARGNGVRVFDFKNDIVYRNQLGQRQKYLINRLPFSAKINGRSGEFYKEEFIDGHILYNDLTFDNTMLEEIYAKYIKLYILENLKFNKPISISITNYVTKLKNEIEEFYYTLDSKNGYEHIFSSLMGILRDLSDYDKFEIPLTISHGDISPRNIIIENRNFSIIDGEHISYRSLFYDLFDFFHQTNQIVETISINPKQMGIKKSLEILSNLEYNYDNSLTHVFWKFYIVNRMLLIMKNVSSKKVISKHFTQLMTIDSQ